MSLARNRLTEERKNWKANHPVGFWAKPMKAEDGSVNLLQWECGIPGKAAVSLKLFFVFGTVISLFLSLSLFLTPHITSPPLFPPSFPLHSPLRRRGKVERIVL
jgi:hypothetical protein